MWPLPKLIDLLGVELPIIQAPMAGASDAGMAIAVAKAGGLGSIPCAMLHPDGVLQEVRRFREAVSMPLNLNFLCHESQTVDRSTVKNWLGLLSRYYDEFDVPVDKPVPKASRRPFDDHMCDLVEDVQPEVISFHFGLPDERLLDRVKATGAVVMSSATTVREACWLENRGCDVVIAQGFEAGGHRATFLSAHLCAQIGTLALVPQIVDAVEVPVVAAGGIGDGRGIAAAIALGASGVVMGTAYLRTPESTISDLYRESLSKANDESSAITNVFTGRPARGLETKFVKELGPLSSDAPAFPHASGAIAPLKNAAEAVGVDDFSVQWMGQAVALSKETGAYELTRSIAADALRVLKNVCAQ